MNASQISSRMAGYALVLILALLAGAPVESRAASDPRAGKGATVFIVRGGGGYFPNLGKIISRSYVARGLVVEDYRFGERQAIVRRIVESYHGGRLPEGVILVGYSLGGCGALDIARSLQEARVPVRLLVLIETIDPEQTVPANVAECFNLYHSPALLGVPVRADSPKTNLVNCDARRDAGFGREYSHFALPWVDGVHELIAGEIVNVIQKKPVGQIAPTRIHVSSAKASSKPQTAAAPASAPETPKTQPVTATRRPTRARTTRR